MTKAKRRPSGLSRRATVSVGGYTQIKNFASKEQCQRWVKHIHNSRSRWRSYEEGAYCYGNSWYLDIESGDLHSYYALSELSNKMLEELPGYVDLLRSASQYLVTADGRRHLPVRARRENLGPYWCDCGIHLFSGKAGHSSGGILHADYEGLAPYPAALFDAKTEAFSCILALQTPDKGGGLEVWPEKRYLGNQLLATHRPRSKICHNLSYAEGTLTILDSFLYHRVSDCWFTEEKNWRVSGVIHFLLRESPYPHWEHWF